MVPARWFLGPRAEFVRERELNAELPESRMKPEEVVAARDGQNRAVIRLLRDDPGVALEIPDCSGADGLLFVYRQLLDGSGFGGLNAHTTTLAPAAEVIVTGLCR